MDLTTTPILGTLWQLASNLGTLAYELVQLAGGWSLWILWIVWWLFAVDWKKACKVMSTGGWVPFILLMILSSLVWSRISPSESSSFGLPNFWHQLTCVSMLVGLAFLCGYLQGLFHWEPAELNFDPPAHGHGHDDHHGHGHDHGHEQHAPASHAPTPHH